MSHRHIWGEHGTVLACTSTAERKNARDGAGEGQRWRRPWRRLERAPAPYHWTGNASCALPGGFLLRNPISSKPKRRDKKASKKACVAHAQSVAEPALRLYVRTGISIIFQGQYVPRKYYSLYKHAQVSVEIKELFSLFKEWA